MTKQYSRTRNLVEGALMIAMATVLSMIPLFQMPYGGSVTLLSMLPLVLMSYRHGAKWGLFTAFVHGVLQLLLGLENLTYCATIGSQIGCILLDYLLAFTALGLASTFAKPFSHRVLGLAVGTFGVCFLRFVCSFLSGWLLWGSYKDSYAWAEDLPVWLYSLIYNGSYMLPEALLTVLGAVLLYKAMPKQFQAQ